MRTTALFAFSLIISINSSAQTAIDLIDLESPLLNETSGLLYFDNSLITFNDQQGESKLYEIDINSGLVSRTITISNATNGDWEDIAQDDDFIYIGDFGNNTGNRTDLKIYKISKTDFKSPNDTAYAEIINFSYADQTDLSFNLNTNFDAEALISIGDNLMIFSKNWGDNKVRVYSLPKTMGTHIASVVSSYDTNGMITGADISSDEKTIFLVGYLTPQAPFMFIIKDIPSGDLDVFSHTVSDKIIEITPLGNQIEGIALFETTHSEYRLYLSNEMYIATAGTITVTFPCKLWLIEIKDESLNMKNQKLELDVNIFPNPTYNQLSINQIVDEVIVFDAFGKLISTQYDVDKVSLDNLKKGVYFTHLKLNNSILIKKVIKR